MAEGDSPMISRRRVRLALREAREARNLTQSDVAEAMEWSLSKVIRIEGGEVSISPNDLRPLLGYLGVRDRAVIDSLIADAKISRTRLKRFWWQDEHFRKHLTPATQRLLEFEQEAVAIRYFSIYLVPGPLQTPSFANVILHQFADDLTTADMEVRAEARKRRRAALLDRANPPTLSLLLDESLVWRPFGGRAVLVEQLTDLHQLADARQVNLRIVPFTLEAPPPTAGAYDLIYLKADGDDENAVIYREQGPLDEIVEDPARARQFHSSFDALWNGAMTEDESLGLLSRRLSELSEEQQPG